MIDFNDDLCRCAPQKAELWECWRREHSQTNVYLYVYLSVCVCQQCLFPSDVPFDLWLQRWSRALTNDTAEFWTELQTFHNNLMSSSSPLLISVIPNPFTPLRLSLLQLRWSQIKVLIAQKCIFSIFAVVHIPFKSDIALLLKFNSINMCNVYKGRENKGVWSQRRSRVKHLDITTLHLERTLCVFAKLVSNVKDEKCCSVVFYTRCWLQHFRQHFSLCLPHTIRSAAISPHFSIFPLLPPPSLPRYSPAPWPLLLPVPSSSLLPHPAPSQPLPPFSLITPSLSLPPTIFSDFLTRCSTECYHLCL